MNEESNSFRKKNKTMKLKDVNTKISILNKTLRHVRVAIHCNPLRFNNSFFYSFPPSHLLMRYAVFCFRSLYLDINLFHDLMFQVSLVLSRCLAPLDVLYTVYMNTYNTKICFDFYETLLLWLAKNT